MISPLILLILTNAIIFVVFIYVTYNVLFFNQILVCFVTAKKNSNNNKDKQEVEKREPRKFLFVLIDISFIYATKHYYSAYIFEYATTT